ncbi:hypothetical protein NLU13_0587 [Sarocladium strictum]|uniref:Translocation protein SEC62 n=1 Tax=Sarocladium strictum TaxID=5046 RepID=A0AA39LBK3_SARSR|nr:hypothetical protein NLU13_0587 [Sarocladium strictum]
MSTSPPQPPTGGQQQPPPSGEQQQGPPGGQGGIPGMPQITLPNGQRPTPEQIQEIQKRLAADAEKMGMTVPQFVEHIKKQAAENQARMRAAQAAGQPMPQGPGGPGGPPGAGQTGRSQPIAPGPPKPEALALAKFLRSQELKPRTCILNGERKDMFRVKRALRAIQSPAYEKARKKNPLLPAVTDRASLENTFKLLPLSMLALRVVKTEPHTHGKKPKRVKGQWTVKIEREQEAKDDMYYVWLWEGSQIKRQLYAALALVLIFAVVLYPLWPLVLRKGVYHLSWGLMGLLVAFFGMAIFRVILFCITYFILPPGFWLFPNLWEDVGFLDSFKPVWAWHETTKTKKKKSKTVSATSAGTTSGFAAATGQPAPATATTTGTSTQISTGGSEGLVSRKPPSGHAAPTVEELGDDDE